MAYALSLFMLCGSLCLCLAQTLAPVTTTTIDGEMTFVVVNQNNGDIYMATVIDQVYWINRLNGDNLGKISQTDVPNIVTFMIIDYRRKTLIVCSLSTCFPHDLETLRQIGDVSAPCVFSDHRSSCTPTGADAVAFFANGNNDFLYTATTPQRNACENGEIPRIASRKSSTDDNFLQFLSGSESGDKRSALFLSSFSRTPDNIFLFDTTVYGFSYNEFSYFVGSFQLGDPGGGRSEARIVRVCQSDTTYDSYMEVPLHCEQVLYASRRRKRQGAMKMYRQAVTWAELATASPSLEMYEGQDVLYYVMSRSVLCVTSMADIEGAFLLNLEMCLNGVTMKSAAPDLHNVTCPRNPNVNAKDVVCGIPGDIPKFSGTVPIVGKAIMDVYSTAMATVVNTGNLSVILRSDGSKIQENVITPIALFLVYEDEQLRECQRPDTQFRISPDNTHLFVFTNGFLSGLERTQYSTTVTKALLANCSAYTYECSSCLSVPFCGWCSEQDRCTMESGCPNGRWFQAESEGRQIYPSCLYIDLVGDYNVTFSPRSGLRTGFTQLQVNITTEKWGYFYGEVMPFVYIGDDVDCQGSFFFSEGMSYFGNSSGPWTYSLQCSVISPGVPYAGIVSVKVMDFNIGPYTLWFNSTEEFKFVVPTFKSFSPLKGPQAGGTLLEIIGTDLLAGNYQNVVIAGKLCEIEMDYSTDERLVCSTSEVVEPTQSLVTINYYDNFSLTSLRRFTYTENPFIEAIFPLRTFVGGGEFQYVMGTNLDSIARPLFVVIAYVNETAVDQFESECRVENSTFMACPSPEILISGLFNDTRSRRSVDESDNECNEITTTPSGESVEFRIGFVLDNVQEWLPSVIQNHLDAKYTTITVARDPVYYMFGGSGNVFSYNPDGNNYLVIEGERLDCGASIQDITIEIGLAFCRPIISLYRTQLTCTPPPSEPPERSEYSRSHGFPHVLVRVGVGDSRYLIGYIDYEDTKSPIEAWVIAIAVCVIVLVLLAIAIIVYCGVRRMRRLSDGAGGKQEKSRQNEYETAHPSSPDAYQSVSFEGGITYMHLSKGRETLMDKLDEGTRLQIQEISIQSSRLQLSSSEVLGKGQFGRVLLGDLLDNDGKRSSQVAVKTLKKYADIDDVRKFLEEGIMMKDFKHPNVLSLIGVCIDDDDCPMIVLPYMKHGDLKSFIEKPERELTVGKLVTYSLHIAQGMEYLSKLKFVHRDLAARNCMVDESETVKVSDFGLSRDIYEREYYASEDKKAKLPIRWMPVESIKKSIFNVKTDVWSYGVLVWELLTRGELPYASIDNWDIPSYLERGRRLPQPAYAPDDLYEVLLRCWHENPAERPEFESVVGQLRNILERGEKGTADKDNYYLQPVESPYYLSLSDSSK